MINKKGFTLLELLVVTAILGVLIGISSTVFISILRSQNKTNITNEVRQNATLAIDLFERDVRSASDINPRIPNNIVTLEGADNGFEVVWECEEIPGDNGVLKRNGVSVTNTEKQTGVGIDCGGPGAFTFVVSDSSAPIVTMRFDALQGVDAPSRADYEIKLAFETTVGVRDFN